MDASLKNLSSPELIAQFVLECRDTGAFLPYGDYSVIQEWVMAMPDIEHLLLILADTLPEYFSNASGRTPRGLRGARKKILQKISAAAKRDL